MKLLPFITERLLLAIIAVVFLLPLSATLVSHYDPLKFKRFPWLLNQTLIGIAPAPSPPDFNWSDLKTGEYQKNVSTSFNQGFAGREMLIRLTSETWFRIFKVSSVATIAIGRDNVLFSDNTLVEHCVTRTPREALEPLVQKLGRFQEECRKRGIPFAFVITPSKATIFPEQIPSGWAGRSDPRPRAYDELVALLKGNRISFIDGSAATSQSVAESPAPVFPRGGVHWGPYPAWKTTNLLLANLRGQGLTADDLEIEPPIVTQAPEGEEGDLMNLMNLAVPWTYPNCKLQIKPRRTIRPRKEVALVGGSFTNKIGIDLADSEQFICYQYFYYKQAKVLFSPHDRSVIKYPVDRVDFEREIFGNDAIVLEANETILNYIPYMGFYSLTPVTQFLDDALEYLDHCPPQPLYPVEWSKAFTFGAGSSPFAKYFHCLHGFGGLEPQHVWTESQFASIKLRLPQTNRDVLLEADAGAIFDSRRFKSQTVKVFANDFPVAEWSLDNIMESTRKTTIPHFALGTSGNLVIRFEIEHPVSPQSIGLADDPRQLGMRLVSMKLSEAGNQ